MFSNYCLPCAVATSPDKATVPLLVVEGLGGDGKANGAGFPTLIIVAVFCVATICIIAAAGFVRFDGKFEEHQECYQIV